MTTNATQPTDLDKRLEELVARTTEFCGCDTNKDVVLCVHDTEAMGELERRAPGFAAALQRARQFLHAIQGAPNVPTLEAAEELAREGRDDPELEELLR